MTDRDEQFMRRAIALAARGRGWVSPNPMVGCVVAKGGRVIAEGYHPFFGGPHAEVVALRKAGAAARGATLYVTLEPCTHWGKTPPCAPAVIQSGVRRVVIAQRDPNPAVSGRGIRLLQKAGLRVDVGVEKAAAQDLNRAYLTWRKTGRPYVVAKVAMTFDGKIATEKGDSRWVSGIEARDLVHRWRADVDAILVGARTANLDNPRLTSHGIGRDPLRVILDAGFRIRPNLRALWDNEAPTLLVTGEKSPAARLAALEKGGVKILRSPVKSGRFDLRKVLESISKMNVSQILVEGGGETLWSFVRAGLVDEYRFFVAPKIVGGRRAVSPVEGDGWREMEQGAPLRWVSSSRVGSDLLLIARPEGR